MRKQCSGCHYPLTTCLCSAIAPVTSAIKVSILQDPIESKHAKNTARLAPLLLANAKLYVGLIASDFYPVIERTRASRNTLLVYPSEQAVSLTRQHRNVGYDHIILLDGTWRKAKKLWFNNPWLHGLDACVINASEGSQYRIRKAPDAQSMSTLEAIAWSLNALEECDEAPFFSVLEALQKNWEKHPHDKHDKTLFFP